MAPSDRYFPATILGGHLHVRGIPEWGPWDPSGFEWAEEAFVDMILNKTTGDRKARTREELEAAIVSGATSGRSWRTMIGRFIFHCKSIGGIMARIVRIHEYGDPSVLKIEDIEVPPPASGEVQTLASTSL